MVDNHDPLCDWWMDQCGDYCNDNLSYNDPCEHMWCTCFLIAKVRADERARQDRDAFTEIRFDGLRMAMGNFDPCPNCAKRPCECKPAPCCGVPWNPQDFTSGKDCWWCQRSTQEMSA